MQAEVWAREEVPGGAAEAADPVEARLGFLNPRFAEERFPWPQVWGYAGSLALTFAALVLVVEHVVPPAVLGALVLVLAAGQAALQLGVFMHIRESRGPAWQIIPLGLAFGIAILLVGFSIWIMTFKWGAA